MIPVLRLLLSTGVLAFLFAGAVGTAPPEGGSGLSSPKGDVLPIKPRVLKVHDRIVAALAFSPDSKTLATTGIDGKVCLWQVATGARLLSWPAHEGGAYAVAFTPDGQLLATGGADHLIRLWDPKTGNEVRSFKGHQGPVSALAISPDGSILASGSYDKTIRLWDFPSEKELQRLQGPEGPVTALSFSPDGKTLVSGGTTAKDFHFGPKVVNQGYADAIRLWDAGSGKLIRAFPGQGSAVQFAAGGRYVAGGGHFPDTKIVDGFLRLNGIRQFCLLDAVTGKSLQTGPFRGEAVAFSSTGRLLATGYGSSLHIRGGIIGPDGENARRSDYTLTLWEAASGQEVLRLQDDTAQRISISPDDKVLATGYGNGTVRLWDISLPSLAKQVEGPGTDALHRWWDDLGLADACKAYRAVFQLAAAHDKAAPFLKERLLSQPLPDDRKIQQFLADLDARDFSTRDTSFKKLEALGRLVEPALREAYAKAPSLEAKKRLMALLDGLDSTRTNPGELRPIRAIQALEMSGSAQAREALRVLAEKGRLTSLGLEARQAIQRLARRPNDG